MPAAVTVSISGDNRTVSSAALALSHDDRRELVLELIWSLRRDDVLAVRERLGPMLQKDIIGCLPADLAIPILGYLNLEDLLQCSLVSKTWSRICSEQGLWAAKCASSERLIRPRFGTTWADVEIHRQLAESVSHSHISRAEEDDDFDAFERDSFDSDDRFGHYDILSSQGGVGGGGGIAPSLRSTGVRRTVWERHRNAPELPMYFKPSSRNSAPVPTNDKRVAAIPAKPSIESHLPYPEKDPHVNFKHLYIVNHILKQRMRSSPFTPPARIHPFPTPAAPSPIKIHPKSLRPRFVDAIGSVEAGGLAGHSEAIYSLELIHRRMTFTLTDEVFSHDATVPASQRILPQHGALSRPTIGIRTYPDRDWLLSTSRDHTLRLWQLSAATPRVVKIFHGGHTSSVLSHTVCTIPIRQSKWVPPHSEPPRSDEPSNRVVAVSGGSDGRICLWDIEQGDGFPEKMIQAHGDAVLGVKGDDERIVSCSKDRTIRVFDIQNLKELLVIPQNQESHHNGAVNSVGLSKEYIVSASGDRTIRVWDIRTGELLAIHDAHHRGIASIDFDPRPDKDWIPKRDGSKHLGKIVAGTADASIMILDLVQESNVPRRVNPHQERIEISMREMLAEGAELLAEDKVSDGDEGSRLAIEWRRTAWAGCECHSIAGRIGVGNGSRCSRCGSRGHTDLVRSLVMQDDLVVSGSYDSTVRMWDRTTGFCLGEMSGAHSGRVFAVVADRTKVISAGLDCRIVVWDFGQGLDTAFVEP